MNRVHENFYSRGATVGFRARKLEQVKCRRAAQDPTKLEAVIPNWSGRGVQDGDLIMPLAHLPDWAEVQSRDSRLLSRVIRLGRQIDRDIDPLQLREIRLSVDAESDDEDEQRAARSDLENEKIDLRLSYLELISMFGREVAKDGNNEAFANLSHRVLLSLAEQNPTELNKIINIIADSLAVKFGSTRRELQAFLSPVGDAIAPVCSQLVGNTETAIGFLSREAQGFEDFRRTYVPIVEGLGLTNDRRGGRFITSILECQDSIADAVAVCRESLMDGRNYKSAEANQAMIDKIFRQSQIIAFAVDGWEPIARLACDMDDQSKDAQIDKFRTIGQIVPCLPTKLDFDRAAHRDYFGDDDERRAGQAAG